MTSKKRILLLTRPICPPWDEASKNFAYTLAKYSSDFEIHLLTCGEIKDLPENVVQRPIYTSSKWNWGQKMRVYVFLVKEIFLKSGKDYDVVHSFFTPTRLNVFALRLCLRNKKIKTIQTLATLRDDLYDENKIKKIIYADYVVAYSDYAKKKLEELNFRNVRRIYPGIDLQKFSPVSKKPEVMEKFRISQNDFVINFTGEFARLGAIDDVVDSFLDLVWKHPNFKLFMACRIKNEKDKKKKKLVEKKLNQFGYSDRVVFAYDQCYKMEDIYNLCDISIFPVRTMAGKFDIPLAVVEAMACAKPVIASNLERLRYFLNDDNSILIKPGDREALEEKILYLYNNPEARRSLGAKGMNFARENFDILRIVEEYKEIYKSL